MDGLMLLVGGLVLLVLAGAICGLIALSRLSALEQDLRKQRQQLQALEQALALVPGRPGAAQLHRATEVLASAGATAMSAAPEPVSSIPASPVAPPATALGAEIEPQPAALQPPTADPVVDDEQSRAHPQAVGVSSAMTESPVTAMSPSTPARLERDIASRWRVWVGGVALALGGVFLVKFGVEHSVLGPSGRVIAGLVLGLVLVLSSEWLRQRETPLALPRLGQQADYVPAALAGGGVIAWYASLLTAFELYDLISPGLAFVLLAGVVVAGHGALLATRSPPGGARVARWLSGPSPGLDRAGQSDRAIELCRPGLFGRLGPAVPGATPLVVVGHLCRALHLVLAGAESVSR